jgi:hypothetical protein
MPSRQQPMSSTNVTIYYRSRGSRRCPRPSPVPAQPPLQGAPPQGPHLQADALYQAAAAAEAPTATPIGCSRQLVSVSSGLVLGPAFTGSSPIAYSDKRAPLMLMAVGLVAFGLYGA